MKCSTNESFINPLSTSLSVSLGLTRVASAVVAVLDNGSIHVERNGDNASCAPFVRERILKHCLNCCLACITKRNETREFCI